MRLKILVSIYMSSVKGPGRPAKNLNIETSRARLMRVAAHLFASEGFDKVSIRTISKEADVTPAMVSYHFGDKAGLLRAVLVEVIDKLAVMVEEVFVSKQLSGNHSKPPIAVFIERYLIIISNAPWIPQILIREVLSADTPLRAVFQEQFISRVWPLVQSGLIAEGKNSNMRSNLDPRYTLLSLIGMCIFPYISGPLLGPMLGFALDDKFAEEYSRHAQQLFLQGVTPKNQGGDTNG